MTPSLRVQKAASNRHRRASTGFLFRTTAGGSPDFYILPVAIEIKQAKPNIWKS